MVLQIGTNEIVSHVVHIPSNLNSDAALVNLNLVYPVLQRRTTRWQGCDNSDSRNIKSSYVKFQQPPCWTGEQLVILGTLLSLGFVNVYKGGRTILLVNSVGCRSKGYYSIIDPEGYTEDSNRNENADYYGETDS